MKKSVKSLLWLVVVMIFVAWVYVVRQDNQKEIARLKTENAANEKQQLEAMHKCVERGIEQYKLMGSYPTLTTGQSARLVAIDACAKDATVYGTDEVK